MQQASRGPLVVHHVEKAPQAASAHRPRERRPGRRLQLVRLIHYQARAVTGHLVAKQHERVVGHHDLSRGEPFQGPHEKAPLLHGVAGPAGSLRHRQPGPKPVHGGVPSSQPTVAKVVPLPGGGLRGPTQHHRQGQAEMMVRQMIRCLVREERVVSNPTRFEGIEPHQLFCQGLYRQVVAEPFQDRPPDRRQSVGDVAQGQAHLVLECLGVGGDENLGVPGGGQASGRNQVGQRLAGAGGGLHHQVLGPGEAGGHLQGHLLLRRPMLHALGHQLSFFSQGSHQVEEIYVPFDLFFVDGLVERRLVMGVLFLFGGGRQGDDLHQVRPVGGCEFCYVRLAEHRPGVTGDLQDPTLGAADGIIPVQFPEQAAHHSPNPPRVRQGTMGRPRAFCCAEMFSQIHEST